MMGVDLPSGEVGVTKATNCIIEASNALFPPPTPALPCIRCTRCADVCPAEVQPQDLYWFAKSNNFGKTQEFHLFDCIECGACAYVCPSHIPLVQYYRYAKSEIWAREGEAHASELARQRHDFRQARIERDKLEKAEKLAQKERDAAAARASATQILAAAQALTQTAPAASEQNTETDDTQQMRISAAIDRAKAQVAAEHPKNTELLTPQQQAEIAEIEARRAKLRELAADSGADDEPPKSKQG
jgi:electron transport complex protein RnfC